MKTTTVPIFFYMMILLCAFVKGLFKYNIDLDCMRNHINNTPLLGLELG